MVIACAWRAWQRARTVALLAIVALAVGIGATTAIYTVVHSVMLAPLPYAHADRFVALYGASAGDPLHYSAHTWPDLVEYQRRTASFDVFGWYRFGFFNLTFDGEPHHVTGAAVTPDLARGLGVSPMAGQWFSDDSGAVISHRLWRRLGADPNMVGRGLTLDGRRLTVTGIMPPRYRLPLPGPGEEGLNSDVW